MFEGEDTNPDNKKKDIKEKDEDNIDLLTADIYIHMQLLLRICAGKNKTQLIT